MRKGIIIAFLLLITNGIVAQELPIVGQYTFNEMVLNPASTGKYGALRGLLSYRKQWISVPGAPETQTFSIQSPLRNQSMAVGLIVYRDKIGVTSETGVKLNYGYRLQLKQQQYLRLGLSGTIAFNQVRLSELNVNNPNDLQLMQNTGITMVPNFGFGAYYQHPKMEFGLSVPRILYQHLSVPGEMGVSHDFSQYHFLVRGLYNYDLNSKVRLIPNFLLKHHSVYKGQLDLVLTGEYQEKYRLGIGYRTSEGVITNIGYALNKQFSLGLQYEIPTTRLAVYKAGTLEVFLVYNALFETKATNPRSF